MAQGTTLKKITTRAKAIRKTHPSMTWKAAIKKSGAEYRGSAKKPTAKKRVVKSSPMKKRIASVSSENLGSLSGVFGKAKKLLESKLGKVEVDIFNATKKSDKNRLRKKKREIVSHLKKTNYGKNIKL